MNSEVQALKKRVHRLMLERAAQKMTIDRLIADIEMTESVGCAFAWDLAETMSDSELPVVKAMLMEWSTALEAGNNYQEARKWIRDQAKKDKAFFDSLKLALDNDKLMEIETPFGRYIAAELLRP